MSATDRFKDFIWSLRKNHKRQLIVAVVILGSITIGLGVWLIFKPITPPTEVIENTNAVEGASANGVSRLNGLPVKDEFANLTVKAVTIENLSTIRPQSGLGSAEIVYETLAEGGITRFLALYSSEEDIDPIGPVRSARHYFVDWAEEFGGMYFHVGGSPQAIGILNSSDYMTDVNQFSYGEYYYRDEEIAAPHNVFTTSRLMAFAERDLDVLATTPNYRSYTYTEEAPATTTTEFKPIIIDFSSYAYQAEWRYEQSTNSYTRYNGGELQIDKNTQQPLSAKVVVVQKVETSLLEADTGRLDIITDGEGDALVFQNGEVIEATWKKADRGERTMFYTKAGEEIAFVPGVMWIEAVQKERNVSY